MGAGGLLSSHYLLSSVSILLIIHAYEMMTPVNECLSPKPNCSVRQPSCRFIIVFSSLFSNFIAK